MPPTSSFQSQQQPVESHRRRSPPPSSADQIPHPHHQSHQQQPPHHQQPYSTSSTPQQYAAYYAAHHHPHSAIVEHPTDGTPLHDPQAQQQALQQDQHSLVDSEGLAAAQLLAAFPQSPAVDPAASPRVSSMPQPAAALTAQEAASADPSHSLQHHQSAPQPIALPFPPPGSVPIAYFAGPNGSIIAIPQIKTKRRQVKNACTNCQKACKKCDEVRPCTRCVKYGIDKDCIDSQRKERKKGVKRGPYKKREPKIDPEEEDPTLPQNTANLAAVITPESAATLQALGGALIYSYTPAMVQSSANGNPASSSSSVLPPSPTQQPQASASSSPSSSTQHHIQLQPAMVPTQMQLHKAPDGSLQYQPQYYIATQPVAATPASGSGMEGNADGEGSSPGPSAQQAQIQQQAFPVQYFGQMAYAGFPGYVVQQPAGSIYQLAPSAMPATTSQHQHHSGPNNDDPIERQNHHQHQGPLPPTSNSSPNSNKGKGKSMESRKKFAAAQMAAHQQEMEQRSRAGGGGSE